MLHVRRYSKTLRHVQKCSTCVKENVAIRLQVKYLLNANSSEIVCSSFLSLTLNKLLRKTFLVRNLISLVLELFFKLSYKSNFIGKWPFKYGFAKLQEKKERTFCQCFFKVTAKESSLWTFS